MDDNSAHNGCRSLACAKTLVVSDGRWRPTLAQISRPGFASLKSLQSPRNARNSARPRVRCTRDRPIGAARHIRASRTYESVGVAWPTIGATARVPTTMASRRYGTWWAASERGRYSPRSGVRGGPQVLLFSTRSAGHFIGRVICETRLPGGPGLKGRNSLHGKGFRAGGCADRVPRAGWLWLSELGSLMDRYFAEFLWAGMRSDLLGGHDPQFADRGVAGGE